MKLRKNRGASLLLEAMIGLSILVLVILAVISLFPISYNTSVQAWKIDGAVALAREVLEKRKQVPADPSSELADTPQVYEQTVQGRNLRCEYLYRVDLVQPTDFPAFWRVTVSWPHSGRTRNIELTGPAAE